MLIKFNLNGREREVDVQSGEILLETLRRLGCWSVKHGCESGECGSCSILLDDRLVPSCLLPAVHAVGHRILTVEGLAEGTELHPIQAAFMETGAIQCGYCTPGMLLATKSLLDRERTPSLDQAREALSAVLCRCNGYAKPVEAVMRAAAKLRGEPVPALNDLPLGGEALPMPFSLQVTSSKDLETGMQASGVDIASQVKVLPGIKPTLRMLWLALRNKKWTPCGLPRDILPSPTISACPACFMLNCSPAPTPMPASGTSMFPGPVACRGSTRC